MPRGGKREGSGRKPGVGGNIMKDAHLNIRLSSEELEKIKEKAKSADMNVSRYVVTCCLKD